MGKQLETKTLPSFQKVALHTEEGNKANLVVTNVPAKPPFAPFQLHLDVQMEEFSAEAQNVFQHIVAVKVNGIVVHNLTLFSIVTQPKIYRGIAIPLSLALQPEDQIEFEVVKAEAAHWVEIIVKAVSWQEGVTK